MASARQVLRELGQAAAMLWLLTIGFAVAMLLGYHRGAEYALSIGPVALAVTVFVRWMRRDLNRIEADQRAMLAAIERALGRRL